MRLLHTSSLKSLILTAALFTSPFEIRAATSTTGSGQSSDSSWPREKYNNGTKLIIYQPQVDDWKNFQDLSWRMAISLAPKSGKTVLGVVEMKGNTTIDNVAKLVDIKNPQITGTYFPSLDDATKEKMDQLFKTFVPPTFSISLHSLIASTPKKEAPAGVQLNNDPPKIFVGYRPSILLSVNGEPSLSVVPNTNLQFVVNTQWPLFFDQGSSTYYLAVGQQWLTANKLDGQWSATKQLPPGCPRCRRINSGAPSKNLSRQLQTQRVQLRRFSTATSRLKSSCSTGNPFTRRFRTLSLSTQRTQTASCSCSNRRSSFTI
jgi:hypothetical protein